MANLIPFFASGTYEGQKANIWVSIIFFANVGNGQVTRFNEYSVAFAGKINTVFYSGELSLELTLKDNKKDALRGPCSLVINEIPAEKATYTVQDDRLIVDAIFGGRVQNVNIRRVNEGFETEMRLAGIYNYSLRLVPVRC